MLEQRGLLLCPWGWHAGPAGGGRRPAADRVRARIILDLATSRQLGLARWKGGLRWPGLGWLGRRVVEVCETEDESLLCLLYRPWSLVRGWEVYDADERLVAAVYSRLVVDCANYPLALFERPNGTAPGRLLSPQGVELATLRPSPTGTALGFAAPVEDNPFAKMALLGAALVAS